MSGVYTLASILSNLVMAVVSGILGRFCSLLDYHCMIGVRFANMTRAVGRMGYYIPWVVFSAVVSAIGSGLLTTFSPDTSHAKWIAYMIVAGTGRGASLQMVC